MHLFVRSTLVALGALALTHCASGSEADTDDGAVTTGKTSATGTGGAGGATSASASTSSGSTSASSTAQGGGGSGQGGQGGQGGLGGGQGGTSTTGQGGQGGASTTGTSTVGQGGASTTTSSATGQGGQGGASTTSTTTSSTTGQGGQGGVSTTSSSTSTSTTSTTTTTSVPSECNPMDPGPVCGPDMHCLPKENNPPYCQGPTGSGGDYAKCNNGHADCGPELACVNVGSILFPNPRCLLWCSGQPDCPEYLVCQYIGDYYANGVLYGVCDTL